MPRVFAPSVQTAGPLGKKKKTWIRRRKTDQERSQSRSPIASFGKPLEEPSEDEIKQSSSKKSQFIGQDLLEWNSEHVASNTSKKPVVTATKRTASQSKAAKPASQKPMLSKATVESHSQQRSAQDAERDLARARQNYLSLTRHALALDTRCLEEETNVCNDFKDFIHTLVVRGATPNLLAVTVSDSNNKKSSKLTSKTASGAIMKTNATFVSDVGIKVFSLADDPTVHKVFGSNIVAPVSVRATSGAKLGSDAVSIPQAMTAEHSWSIMGEMIDSILTEDKKLGPSQQSPLDITILVTDVSLFCDTDVESHKDSVDRFANFVAPFFQKSLLNSIQVVAATTDTLALLVDHEQLQDGSPAEHDVDGDVQMKNDENSAPNQAVQNHEGAVTACIEAIQAKLEEHEYVAHSHQGISIGQEGGNPINVSFSVFDSNPVGYRQLSRQWIRESLLVRRLSSRIRFDLPETLEGLQCSVSLDANYQIFPFAIDTPQAKMLLSDLDQMPNLDIRVMQLVPLSIIDASLLYGIPMTVRAGLENDFAQFQEMQILVCSLFRLLQERELAMLLRATDTAKTLKKGFFQANSEQLFVLMAQELPSSMTTQSPPAGLLYRIAHADQFLAETTATKSVANTEEEERESQYIEYIESALACLDVGPFNPLDAEFLQSMKRLTPESLHASNTVESTPMEEMQIGEAPGETPLQAAESTGEDADLQRQNEVVMSSSDEQSGPSQQTCVWDDSVGVGALGPLPTQEDASEDYEDDNGISAFEEDL